MSNEIVTELLPLTKQIYFFHTKSPSTKHIRNTLNFHLLYLEYFIQLLQVYVKKKFKEFF